MRMPWLLATSQFSLCACLLSRQPHCLTHAHPLLPPRPPGPPQDGGSWNLREVRFLVGSQLPSWGIAAFGDPRRMQFDLEQPGGQHGPSFIKEFVDM